jgi:hypothetical protein
LREAKVDANAFGVPYMQIAVGLGRKAGAYFGWIGLTLGVVGCIARAARPAAAGVGALLQVFFDDLAQEVADFMVCGWGCGVGRCHGLILEE